MTTTNPHPLANPLNSRVMGNGYSSWVGTAFRKDGNLSVPVPKPYVPQNPHSLKIPSGNPVPMGSEHLMAFEPRYNKDLFQLSDGTLISKSTGRIVRRGTEYGSSLECWGNRKIGNPFGSGNTSWNELDGLPLNMDPYERRMAEAGLSREDIEYAKRSEIENKKLLANMNEEQKRLLKKLENGKITKPSRLIPDDCI